MNKGMPKTSVIAGKKGQKKGLSSEQREEILKTLKTRFERDMHRHKGLAWAKVQAKLSRIRPMNIAWCRASRRRLSSIHGWSEIGAASNH